MAKIYEDFRSETLMSFGKSFSRLNGQPLDDSSIYYSLEAAQTYAASASAYVGQPIAVINKDTKTAKLYLIENEDGSLQEIGSKVGFEDLNTTYTISVSNDDKKYTITLTPSEGDAQPIELDLSTYVTQQEMAEAIAAADHLVRKIITEDQAVAFIAAPETAEKNVIYMVKIGSVSGQDNYEEYMRFDSNTEPSVAIFEKIGDTSVDLTDYAKTADVVSKEDIKAYDTAEVAATKYADKTATEEALENKVDKEEGKSLVSDSEITKLSSIASGAEKNVIDSATDKFTISDSRELDLTSVPQGIINGLNKTTWAVETSEVDGKQVENFIAATVPATLSEILVSANYNSDTKTGNSGLMTAEQAQKLSLLAIGDSGLEISGKVTADNITGLSAWITNNRDTVEGLYPTTAVTLLAEHTTKIANHEERITNLETSVTWQNMTE